jgi:hypothetical protein
MRWASRRRTTVSSQVEDVMNCRRRWWSTPNRAAIGCIDLRWPSVISPRMYNVPLSRWSTRAKSAKTSPVNSSNRGGTSAI